MGKLKILAGGNSPQAQAQGRGKLFEELMAKVLRRYGYSIDKKNSNINYAGMEIDIEGKHIPTGIPLYAECKCYETEVDSPKLQAFYGKYITKWFQDNLSHGLFIALPGVNSHAKGFYRENCENNSRTTFCLYEEEQVLNAIFDTQSAVRPDVISRFITNDVGTCGDRLLLYTDKGPFWIQYVIPKGGGIPAGIALFDAVGNLISDKATHDYLTPLYPELGHFELISITGTASLQAQNLQQDAEEIVNVTGSSACFEYQFPASPKHFVGRQSILEAIYSFALSVLDKETSSRGILFQANSGWGKSSTVLKSVACLQDMGHFAVAIDSRTASSSQFILRVVDYALREFGNFGGLLSKSNTYTTITGFDGAVEALLNIGEVLASNHKLMFIFLDQFENLFFLQDALRPIRDMFLKICDAQTSIVFGFSWKTDLIGSTSEFPYQLREAIMGSSKRIDLETFSEVETAALLHKLSQELRAPLKKELEFFLSEFSRGYPWLLKKLCAHVKLQREAGVLQSDIANSLLNVEELFQEDLRGLQPEEEDTLRRIAKVAPIGISELGEEFKHEVVQSLVHSRLVVRIGHKYDVYWDIFRDYLNSGLVPVQENYLLRVEVRSVLKATKYLTESSGILTITEFQKRVGLSEKSFYNIIHDMRLIGLANIDGDKVRLQVSFPKEVEVFEDSLRSYLRDKLRRNRLVWQILEVLESGNPLNIEEVSDILAKSSPYTSATKETWRTYGRTFSNWIDTADLAIYDSKNGTLDRYKIGAQVRESRALLVRRSSKIMAPLTQYRPIENVVIKLVEALQKDVRIDWTGSGIKKSTISRALASLEAFNFISRKTQSIEVLSKGREFVLNPEKRSVLFAEAALKMNSFATFIDILEDHKDATQILSLSHLAKELKEKLNADWQVGTGEVYVKIMLDWARHTGLAPGIFAHNRRGLSKGGKKENS